MDYTLAYTEKNIQKGNEQKNWLSNSVEQNCLNWIDHWMYCPPVPSFLSVFAGKSLQYLPILHLRLFSKPGIHVSDQQWRCARLDLQRHVFRHRQVEALLLWPFVLVIMYSVQVCSPKTKLYPQKNVSPKSCIYGIHFLGDTFFVRHCIREQWSECWVFQLFDEILALLRLIKY